MQSQRIAGGRQRLHAFPQQLAVDVEQRHTPAFSQKPSCHREPDAARSAGYQRDFLRGGGHGRSAIG
jgi:hypothetical protein